MRTTLTLEDDLAEELKRLAQESRRGLKSVVNELLRAGLEKKRQERTPVFREQPVALGLGREYRGKLNQVADELWTEDYLAKDERAKQPHG